MTTVKRTKIETEGNRIAKASDKEELEVVAKKFWQLENEIFDVLNTNSELCGVCSHHYKTAFVHGHKHALEGDKNPQKLADDHWSYLYRVLSTHGITKMALRACGFYYKRAFIAGFDYGNKEVVPAVNLARLYDELIMAVGNKYPGESRHKTALRLINSNNDGSEECEHEFKFGEVQW